MNKSKSELCAVGWVTSAHFLLTATQQRVVWETLCRTLSTQPLQTVALGMVTRFMSGSGTDYSHSDLTAQAKAHPTTQIFYNSSVTALKSLLTTYGGNIQEMKYVASNRKNDPLVPLVDKIPHPVFDTASDYANGLKICVNDTWGHEIIVKSYASDGIRYTGVLTFRQ